MRALLVKLFCVAVLGLLVAAPALAVDAGAFKLDRPVMVGSNEIPAGVYVFTVSDRGFVLVYDETFTKIITAAVTRRNAISLDELEKSDTLAYDWAVREFSLGRFVYTFSPGKMPVTTAAYPTVVTTRIALAR